MDRIPRLLPWFTAVLFLITGAAVFGQQERSIEQMETGLCACMGSVDLRSTDAEFQLQVRQCLESAVMQYPAAMSHLLRTVPGNGPKGEALGELLGERLDRRCAAFRAVRERLRRLNAQGGLLKGES